MLTIPYNGPVLIPDVNYYFQKQYFEENAGVIPANGENVLFLIQKEENRQDPPKVDEFYPMAIVGKIQNVDNDGNVTVHMEKRVSIDLLEIEGGRLEASFSDMPEVHDEDPEKEKEDFEELKKAMLSFVSKFQWGFMARNYIRQWDNIDEAMAVMSRYLQLSNEEKYQILAADTITGRHQLMKKAIYEMIELANVSNEVQQEQTKNNEKLYREDAIKKQMALLQKELDEMHPENITDVRKFELKIAEAGMNETARKEAEKILNRMKQEGENSHEYGAMYEYLDFVTQLSWKKEEFSDFDLKRAEKILDEDHYGLKKPKRRIIQQLAVMALNKKQSGSILLFVGAPGTGKTSIGQSIARALNRKYVRISLGGIRDEAEIRGHRRTYVGAMPGRIMEGMKQAASSNPVMVLDEVDKLVKGFDGDPSSALLEVLDPEQNSSFTDHYMNVPYDLSDVLFVCTANSIDTIPEPLLNRMEIIEFQGYTETEKVQIARRHLIPKAMENCGLKKSNLKIPDTALHTIISDYTMEAGVRGLKKRIDSLCRAAAVRIVKNEGKSVSVSVKNLSRYLEMKPVRHNMVGRAKQPGIVTGLAWTQAGGDVLFIETMFTKGSGKVIITGQLGDVMKESVQIAVTLVKSMYPEKADMFKENDLHIHVPAGATPKDGPSAGITLTTALASLVRGQAVDPTIAMTGEVSLAAVVMPIGGLPEKLMAAVRSGVKTVFVPKDNEEDLKDVPEEIRAQLKVIPVEKAEEVLQKVFPGFATDRRAY